MAIWINDFRQNLECELTPISVVDAVEYSLGKYDGIRGIKYYIAQYEYLATDDRTHSNASRDGQLGLVDGSATIAGGIAVEK